MGWGSVEKAMSLDMLSGPRYAGVKCGKPPATNDRQRGSLLVMRTASLVSSAGIAKRAAQLLADVRVTLCLTLLIGLSNIGRRRIKRAAGDTDPLTPQEDQRCHDRRP